MSMMHRSALSSFVLTVVAVGEAFAQGAPADPSTQGEPAPVPPPVTDPTTPPTPPTTDPTAPTAPPVGTEASASASASATPEDDKKPKEPKRGDFNAGGQVRLPSGPDEMGQFATFNWVAFDLKGQYMLLDQVSANFSAPLAIIKPDNIGGAVEPSMIGGMLLNLEAKAKMPKMPFVKQETEAGLSLTVGYMRKGAMLLSEKDYPLFVGDFKPGFAGGVPIKVKLGKVVDFKLAPAWVYQSGTMESVTAVQLPLSLVVGVGSLAKVSADVGIYTGDDYSFSGSEGGRISAGGALDLKLGPIIAHAGEGVASLLTGGLYPSIGESVYIDLNVKYAK